MYPGTFFFPLPFRSGDFTAVPADGCVTRAPVPACISPDRVSAVAHHTDIVR